MFREFKDIFEDPTSFFEKERKFRMGFVFFLVATVVTAVMTEILIQTRFIDFGIILDPYFAVPAKIVLSIAGYFVISSLCAGAIKLFKGHNIKKFYTVSAYSLFVLIFIWVPHVLVSAVIFAWFILLMVFGMKHYNGLSHREGLLIVSLFIVLVVVLAFLVHDFVPIFPYNLS